LIWDFGLRIGRKDEDGFTTESQRTQREFITTERSGENSNRIDRIKKLTGIKGYRG
jgi:hypothetical protein